jgi:hypothetical protein
MTEVVETTAVPDELRAHPKDAAISLPGRFRFNEVPPEHVEERLALPPEPTLGPLAAFVGTWRGNGFNTIFRPNSPQTPTPLPIPEGGDNVLELNLTEESLAFSPSLGSVPNRGMTEADAFLNGVPYLQTISDITMGQPVGIHVEPGLWMCVPPTLEETVQTVARMASIPHGTTILAQGTSVTFAGPPNIPPASITPFFTQPAGTSLPPPGPGIAFPSQVAADGQTARIPQDLTPFINAGTITQAILDDPNTVLRNHNNGLNIVSTTAISVSTAPTQPLFGGGTDNIAFLLGSAAALGNPQAPGENAQTLQMQATFWINTVEFKIVIPIFEPHDLPLHLKPESTHPTLPLPTFTGKPPKGIPAGHVIKIRTTQIQYSQTVMLNFNGLTWPHVSVATLVPAKPIPIPPAAWK